MSDRRPEARQLVVVLSLLLTILLLVFGRAEAGRDSQILTTSSSRCIYNFSAVAPDNSCSIMRIFMLLSSMRSAWLWARGR
jgi:hypothetical protein